MAVVMTIKASNGATVRIHDDYLPKTDEEARRRRAAAQKELNRIYTEGALRRYREWREKNPDRDPEEWLNKLRAIARESEKEIGTCRQR